MMTDQKNRLELNKSSVAVVVPLLNEIAMMPSLLSYLQSIDVDELVVVDGGSQDGSWKALLASGVHAVRSEPGRAKQMNAGASGLKSDYIVFLHADTQLPKDFRPEIQGAWGRFDVSFKPSSIGMYVVAFFMNLRSRLSHIATGDQAIFVKRDVFDSLGGFQEMAIMEDVDLSHRLRQFERPFNSRKKVTTSARRWQQDGVLKTILLMWRLRLAFTFGARPSLLKQRYRDVR